MGLWNDILVGIGARAPASMSTAQAIRAFVAGEMSLAQAAAACGLSVGAFRAQLAAAGYLARRGGFVLLSGLGAAALLAVVVAAGVGYAMYATKDRPDTPPVEAGWNMRYYVVVAETGRGIWSIRTEGAVERGIPWRAFRHGGISRERARVRKVAGPFGSTREATRWLATRVRRGSLRKPPLAAGTVGVIGGQAVTIDDRGHVDFKLLRRLAG